MRTCHGPALRCAAASAGTVLVLACLAWAVTPEGHSATPDTTSADLIWAAWENERAGHNDQREALLERALKRSPENLAIRGQLGYVRNEDTWVKMAQVEHRAQHDQRLAEYRRRRDAAAATVADQVALARWCRKNKLTNEERVHWLLALQLDPAQPDAIKALGLHLYQGMLLTNDQIAQVKRHAQDLTKAREQWRPLVTRWRRAIDSHETSPPSDVREGLLKISRPAEMLALERAVWQQCGAKLDQKSQYHAMTLELIRALNDNPNPAAAQSLARHAVFSPFEDTRSAAVAGLKQRPLDQYVPLLLSGLQTPFEVSIQSILDPEGRLITHYSLYQEGALADVSLSSTLLPLLPMDAPIIDAQSDVDLQAKANAAANRERQRLLKISQQRAAQNTAIFNAIDRINRASEQRNIKIMQVLREITGQDLGDRPTRWWDWWWLEYNGSYSVKKADKPKPKYEYYAVVTLPSCFASGTKVWTLTGRQPIEQIKVGDQVLAQDVNTGELAYKPVLATTIREPGPRMKIGLGPETITTTLSHPFWVLGEGWQMTKQLEAGSRLHALSGGVLIENLEKVEADPSPAGSAYNLIVADFGSYFVGDQGILVHDNTPREPTAALIPGLQPESPQSSTADP